MAFGEWADRSLPYALLPLVAYGLFYGFRERLPLELTFRRLLSFFVGCNAALSIGEALRNLVEPSGYILLAFPFLAISTILLIPSLVILFIKSRGFKRFASVLAGLSWTLAAAFLPWFFLRRLWYFALPLILLLFLAAWFSASRLVGRQKKAEVAVIDASDLPKQEGEIGKAPHL